jgi:hypothetical protein
MLFKETLFEETLFEETLFEQTLFVQTLFEQTLFEQKTMSPINHANIWSGLNPIAVFVALNRAAAYFERF